MRVTSLLLASVGYVSLRADAGKPPVFFEGTGAHTRWVSNRPEVQRSFDQGVAFISGFNYDEGLRMMEQAARLDPTNPMVGWGVALACGPHINSTGVSAERSKRALAALKRAKKSKPQDPVVQDLIAAMQTRFSSGQAVKRKPLDEAYAAAMREVWKKYPEDADVGAWFAEAMMMLRPWDLWQASGEPQPGTEEILAALETVLGLMPDHPLANHLAVHAYEASKKPERGMPAADRLRVITPGLGHMVHMSSHIDVRCGQWEQAVIANTRSIAINRDYRAKTGQSLSAYLNYIGHDYHLLAYAAMMSGRSHLALQTMKAVFVEMPPEWKRDSAIGDGYLAMQFDVLKRFGRWDELLSSPEPAATYPHARAWRLLGRGIAHAAQGSSAEARREQADYLKACQAVSENATYRKNPLKKVLAIATLLLEGEILLSEGKAEPAMAVLKEAILLEDKLHYAEPPAWAQPVRHALGAALMQRLRFEEAEAVYREDLARIPDNGWSLFGLAQALRMQDKNRDEAAALEARFSEVWSKADVTLTSSCFCQPGS